tara:strand:- start:5 stop:268 length:264 start_codon:yes stop_codon:yes gene_type:complete
MKTKKLNKLSISECRKFLKDKKNMQFKNLYAMITKYVSKYDNQESQYMIQTSKKYRDKVYAEKKTIRHNGKLYSQKEYFETINYEKI